MSNLKDYKAIVAERQAAYGHPRQDFTRTAQMWSAIIGYEVSPEQVPLCMIALKLSREVHKHKPDNMTDVKGYAECIEMMYE